MGNNKYSELVHYTQSNFIQPATNFTLVAQWGKTQTKQILMNMGICTIIWHTTTQLNMHEVP